MKRRRPWTEPEDAILRDFWGKLTCREIGARIGRTATAVGNRAHRLGLPSLGKGGGSNGRVRMTCKRGHRYSADNVYIHTSPTGQTWRTCKLCAKIARVAREDRKEAERMNYDVAA
jgi:hypothetical protein